jgi:hypothetical protein
MIRAIWPLIALLLTSCGLTAQALGYSRDASGIRVSDHGKPVLYYRTAEAAFEGQYPRANYIHPLYGIDGEILTEDFPEDHLHHRGIFWAWHQVLANGVPMGDSWECRDFIWDVDTVEVVPADSVLTLNSRVLWKSPAFLGPEGKKLPFVLEKTEIRIHARTAETQAIDFEISLLALVPNLRLGGSDDEKGYGGFSVRMKLPEGIGFFSDTGPIFPRENAVEAASWMNITGALGADGKNAGLLIFGPAKAGGKTASWILREKGSMQNAVFPGRTPVAISMHNPTVLRYRLVVYKGQLSREQIASLKPPW